MFTVEVSGPAVRSSQTQRRNGRDVRAGRARLSLHILTHPNVFNHFFPFVLFFAHLDVSHPQLGVEPSGSGCSQRDGGEDFTGGEACCTLGVKGLGRVCSSSVGAPCVIDGSIDDDDVEGELTSARLSHLLLSAASTVAPLESSHTPWTGY